ncbi:MAG: citramalate synthase, partial [Thermoguttaceae bacterium]|nr:citramalate synthase [Thermoguttaceae bacterium]
MMRRIEFYDTTLRDGAQTEGIAFSLMDKIQLVRRLDKMGFDYIEGGYPASNDKDEQFFQKVQEEHFTGSLICAFGMTRRKGRTAESDGGLKSLVNSNAPVVTIVGKSSAYQVTEVIQTSLVENLRMIEETVAWLSAQNRTVFYDAEHFFDGWKADPEYSLETLRCAVRAGAKTIQLCDTNGGCMPEEIAAGVG